MHFCVVPYRFKTQRGTMGREVFNCFRSLCSAAEREVAIETGQNRTAQPDPRDAEDNRGQRRTAARFYSGV